MIYATCIFVYILNRDSDVEEYLRGILWTVQMYSDGFCSDVSYTYAGRPPVSPFLIVNYISKVVWKNCLLAGMEDFDLLSTVRHLFRSLHNPSMQPVSGPSESASVARNSKVSKAAMEEQLKQLQNLILGNKIGVGAGGVSWQELKSNVYVPTSSSRPLSADATCACLLPQSATEKVPLHLRHVWSEMHDGFFEELDDLWMRRSTYSSLTGALEKVFLYFLLFCILTH